jgi:hypothetical protein
MWRHLVTTCARIVSVSNRRRSLVVGTIVLLICMGLAPVMARGAGTVELTQSCEPETVNRREVAQCEVTATNNSHEEVVIDLDTSTSRNLHILAVDGTTRIDVHLAQLHAVSLAGVAPGVPSVAPGSSPAGYVPLDAFGIIPTAIGDEDIINFTVSAFEYAGQTWTRIGVDSNGYLLVGGGDAQDNNCCSLPSGPSADRPNNVLAPFWTDLDGTGAPGIFAGLLTDGVNTWLVAESRLNVFGTTSLRVFQVWIGLDGVQDVTYAYDPANLPGDPSGQDFLVGAENALGQGGMTAVLPTEDLRVSSTAAVPGDSISYALEVKGQQEGIGTVTTEIQGLPDVVITETEVEVLPKKP